MVIFLFGEPGAGKNYVGELLSMHFGYYFWDADLALSVEMQNAIINKQVFTQKMRDHFTQVIIGEVKKLKKKYNNVVVSQALFKEKNRLQIAHHFPGALFFLILSSFDKIKERLQIRKSIVDSAYAEKIRSEFEEPLLPHKIIINDSDQEAILKQLRLILPN